MPRPLTEEQIAGYETQAAEALREKIENPHTVPMGDAAAQMDLAVSVQRLVAEVRRLRQLVAECGPYIPDTEETRSMSLPARLKDEVDSD
jgi:hypothetical protein